ncbi:DinB family protein [Cucumibacter marinus]|uniref:DinB family protein n=1 Tax=Cucumibacter marinus TaxID=1121252 RepID=UPI0004141307|nr:DinB family protein [Cucumibacter marinus]
MITPAHAQTFARYNQWQNQSLFEAASRLSAGERQRDQGAFFGSIEATLNHIYWADRIWMHRIAGDPAPRATTIPGSLTETPDWQSLVAARATMDERLIEWAEGLEDAALVGDLKWYSGAVGKEVSRPRTLIIAHLFNHQTHHRGQVHAMLTAAGSKPSQDTDIVFMPGVA